MYAYMNYKINQSINQSKTSYASPTLITRAHVPQVARASVDRPPSAPRVEVLRCAVDAAVEEQHWPRPQRPRRPVAAAHHGG